LEALDRVALGALHSFLRMAEALCISLPLRVVFGTSFPIQRTLLWNFDLQPVFVSAFRTIVAMTEMLDEKASMREFCLQSRVASDVIELCQIITLILITVRRFSATRARFGHWMVQWAGPQTVLQSEYV
jgi:hypothetical protein